jgi:adenosylcobinamide kinase / adenosylcobinamide-phosphate guanylyltransferase
MGSLTLITGASRSGKSAYALELASANSETGRFFIATAEARDDEMRARIAQHRAGRAANFHTIEEPFALADTVESLKGQATVVVLDCLTLWVANLIEHGTDGQLIEDLAEELARGLGTAFFSSFVVTSEVGWGIVPDNYLGRRFRDLLGRVNQRFARVADSVVLMVAGYPLRVK